MKKLRNALKTKSVRVGSYSVAAVAVVLAILVAINLLLGALPAKYTMFDLSKNLLYSFSAQTKKIVSEADRDITIYWLAQTGSENSTLEGLLNRYESLGSRLTVKKIDPDNYPTFADKYDISEVANNSLIVESDLRFRVIPYSDIFVTEYSYDDEGNYTGMTATLDGESELTSAISFVLNENPPKAYCVTGHGETALSDSYLQGVEAENVTVEDISLVSVGEVPEDCSILMILAPLVDISEQEANIILEYLKKGGRLMLVTDPAMTDRTNLYTVTSAYALREYEGIVVEGDTSHYPSSAAPYYLFPDLEEHAITTPLINSKMMMLLPLAHGIKTGTRNDGETITTLLKTSSSSFSKLAGYDMGETYEKESGDITGPFKVAVLMEQESDDFAYDNTMIIWIGSASILNDTFNEAVSGANQDFFLNSLSYLTNNANNISIHAKNLMNKYLTVPSSASTIWSIILIGALPVLVIAAGVVVFTRRRKR